MLIEALAGTAELLGGLCLLAGLLAVFPRTRRVAYAVYRFGKRHMPGWMLAIVAVCGAIPGPLDEMIVLPILVLILLRTSRKRQIFARYVRTAWTASL